MQVYILLKGITQSQNSYNSTGNFLLDDGFSVVCDSHINYAILEVLPERVMTITVTTNYLMEILKNKKYSTFDN